MRRLACVLFQLDEARRYIEDGRIEHLRLALLLLDNAAEVQMDRCIRDDLSHDRLKEKLRKHAVMVPEKERGPHLQDFVTWTPLTQSEKYKLDRYFDEKVDYMTGRGGHIGASLAGPLKHLHQYRNEAYHRADLRPQTLRTAALVLLEISCEMALAISPAAHSIGSNEDYSWLQERFGWNPLWGFLDEKKLCSVIEEIRSSVLPDDQSVAATLANHMEDRFARLDGALAYIVENVDAVPDKQAVLEESERYAELRQAEEPRRPSSRDAGGYTLAMIEAIEARAAQIAGAATRLDAFDRFSAVERELEPIEHCVYGLAREVSWAIQTEIDRLRGK